MANFDTSAYRNSAGALDFGTAVPTQPTVSLGTAYQPINYEMANTYGGAPTREAAPTDDMWEVTKGVYRGANNLQALGAGAVGLLADAIGMDTLREWGYEEYQQQLAEASEYAPEVESYRDIDTPEAFVSYLMGTLGELAPSIAQAIISGGVAGFAGKVAVKKAIKKAMDRGVAAGLSEQVATRQALKEVAKTLSGRAVAAAPAATVALSTGAQEAGGMWAKDTEELGLGNVSGERMLQAAGLGALSGSLELVGIDAAIMRSAILPKLLGKTLSRASEKRLSQSLGAYIAKGTLGEGTTEAAQEAISAFHSEGFDISPESLRQIEESFVAGALGGGVFGGVNKLVSPTKLEEDQNFQPDEDVVGKAAEAFDNEQITGDKNTSYADAMEQEQESLTAADAVLTGQDNSAVALYDQQIDALKAQGPSVQTAADITKIEELKTEALKTAERQANEIKRKSTARLQELQQKHDSYYGGKLSKDLDDRRELLSDEQRQVATLLADPTLTPEERQDALDTLKLLESPAFVRKGNERPIKRAARSRLAWENTLLQQLKDFQTQLGTIVNSPLATTQEKVAARTGLVQFSNQLDGLIKDVKSVPDTGRASVTAKVSQAISQNPAAPVTNLQYRKYKYEEGLQQKARNKQLATVWRKTAQQQEIAEAQRLAASRATAQEGYTEGRMRWEAEQQRQQRRQQLGEQAVRLAETDPLLVEQREADVAELEQAQYERALENERRPLKAAYDRRSQRRKNLREFRQKQAEPKQETPKLQSRVAKLREAKRKKIGDAEKTLATTQSRRSTRDKLNEKSLKRQMKDVDTKAGPSKVQRQKAAELSPQGGKAPKLGGRPVVVDIKAKPAKVKQDTSVLSGPKQGKFTETLGTTKVIKDLPKHDKGVKQVNSWVKNSLLKLPKLRGRVHVVRNAFDERIPMTEAEKKEMRGARAVFVQSTGQIYIFADHIKDKREAVRTLLHEGIAHFGLRTIFTAPQLQKFLRIVYEAKKDDKKFQKWVLQDGRYSDLDKLDQAEEYLARLVERQTLGYHLNKDEQTVIGKVKALIARALKRIFNPKAGIADKEINNVLSRVVFNLAKEHGGRGYRKDHYSQKDVLNIKASALGRTFDADLKAQYESPLKKLRRVFKGTFGKPTVNRDVRPETILDSWITSAQDEMRRVKVVQEHVTDTRGKITQDSDVYKTEELSKNKVRAERKKFDKKFIYGDGNLLALITQTAKKGESLDLAFDKVDLLAQAIHAPERNERIAYRSALLEATDVSQILGKNDKTDAELSGIAQDTAKMLASTGGRRSSTMSRDLSQKWGITPEQAVRLLEEAKKDANFSGSGWTTAEAKEVQDKLDTPDRRRAVQKLHEINDYRLDILVKEGLVKPEVIAEWKRAYQLYVPLKDWDTFLEEVLPEHMRSEETKLRHEKAKRGRRGGAGAAAGVGPSWKASKAALGRDSIAASPITSSIAQVHDVIAVAEKNKVGKSLLKLVEDNPEFTHLWLLEKDAPYSWSKYFNTKTGGIDLRKDASKFKDQSDQVITVLIDGTPVRILVKDEGMARALKHADASMLPPFFRVIGSAMRFMAKTLTSWNPAFWPTNAVRDFWTSAINLRDVKKQLGLKGNLGRKLMKDYLDARRTIYRDMMDKKNKSEYSVWFERFKDNGAFTEMYGIKDFEGLRKDMKKEVRRLGVQGVMGDTTRLARKGTEMIEAFSTSLENTTRLIAFKNISELLISEKGFSEKDAYKEAASAALNLTVNFTRRGSASPWFGALYLFFNAAMQSNARMIQTVARNPHYMGYLVLGAFAWSMMADTMGGEDEKGNSYYEMLPDWEKNNNLILMSPTGSGKYTKIPLPYGFNIFNVIGQNLQSLISKAMNQEATLEDGTKVITESLNSMFNNFVPLGDASEGLTMFAPSIVRPLLQVQQNKDFFGKPIYPESMYMDRQNYPDSQKYWSSVSELLRTATTELNRATGGTKYTKGLIDLNPEVVEHLLSSYLGGLAQTFDRTERVFTRAAQGSLDTLEFRDIPVVRRFMGQTQANYAFDSRYRDVRGKVEAASNLLDYARTSGDSVTAVRKKYRKELALRGQVKAAERQLRLLYKRQKALRAAYFDRNSISYSAYYLRKKALDKKKEKILSQVLKAADRRGVR